MIPNWCVSEVPSGVCCSECGEALYAHEEGKGVMTFFVDKYVDLHRFVGMTLKEVERTFHHRTDGLHTFNPLYLIINEGRIEEGKMYCGCNQGNDENTIVQVGDVGSMRVHHFAHERCNRTRLTCEGREEFAKMFRKAGFELKNVFFQAVPHGHFPKETAMLTYPWYMAHTPMAQIRVGWQASILNINWANTGRNLKDLFTNENVTKSPCEVHARDEQQGIDFLSRIRKALSE